MNTFPPASKKGSLPGRTTAILLAGFGALFGGFQALSGRAEDVDKRVLDAEARRVTAVDKVRPSVVAIFAQGGQGGGSGVLISKDGYALTNFHVTEGAGNVMQCGLPDGMLYDAVLIGLDRVGDVALIKLLPKKEGKAFPFAVMGDSDKVNAGDSSLAMGNPFLLATDFQPTVTFGVVSGVHRYQYPAGTLLEYTDCIQVDTSINPGNSGGPLFNMTGELIGINGRGSFEKRGRVNSGVGYAISINQIKNFMGHLRAGLDADHATLGALVQSASEEGEGASGKLMVTSIVEDSDARRRGLDEGDELVSFAGRPMTSVNQFKNALGLYPKGWKVPLVYRRNNEKHEVLVRLMQLQQSQALLNAGKPRPRPGPPRPQPPPRYSPASQLFEARPGFANYYFNKLERDRLLGAFRKHGDFSTLLADWNFEADNENKAPVQVAIREEMGDKGPDDKPVAREGTYHLKADMIPELPKASDDKEDKTPLREAVRKAVALMQKHAKSFPQEFWAPETDPELKEQINEVQKDVAIIQAKLLGALEELKDRAADRAKEPSKGWQANYDYTTARLGAFVTYVYEYNFMLGQLRKSPPKRDPKVHRGWRMLPDEKLQSGPEAKKLAAETDKIWDRLIKDFRGTKFDDLAQKGKKTLLGLTWVPTGGTRTVVRLNLGPIKYNLDPLKFEQNLNPLKEPAGSGGMMVALYQYRRLLTLGLSGFEGHFQHNGYEPFYVPAADGKPVADLKDSRKDAEVLFTEHAAVPAKWYFAREDQGDIKAGTLLGFEVTVDPEDDPCEVYLYDYKPVQGRMLPHRIEVRKGSSRFTTLNVKGWQFASAK
jgi:S1-C subfamily serine protease